MGNKPVIDFVKIHNLFGNRDVTVDLSTGILILIGENGMGKTTILNILNEILKGDLENLASYIFSDIEIKFSHLDKSFNFTLESIKGFREMKRRVCEDLDEEGVDLFVKEWVKTDFKDNTPVSLKKFLNSHPKIEDAMMGINVNIPGLLEMWIEEYPSFFIFKNEISKIGLQVVYLPTYRRIEANYDKVFPASKNVINRPLQRGENYWYFPHSFSNDLNQTESLLKFGMKDISEKINNLLKKISDESIKGYNEVSGKMISKLLDSGNDREANVIVNPDYIRIILERLGTNVSESERKQLVKVLDSQDFSDNSNLAFYLSALSEVYRRTEKYDLKLKRFILACNEFLFDKEFRYDESHISVKLFSISDVKGKRELSLEKLSSGEKQLISILAITYLNNTSNLAVLMDEPEISLSLLWQRKLLPIIADSGNCRLLIAATHSPFVFDNKLKTYTKGPAEYVELITH